MRADSGGDPGTRPPRIGLFGLLGSGNIGNDGSLEALLGHLRERHPDARVELMCGGPRQVSERYGVPAVRLHWSATEYRTASDPVAVARKAFGKLVDAVRIARWAAGQDLVIVPGMGVLEASVPMRPWAFPYSLFLLCAGARLVGTPAALVGVGAEPIEGAAIRRLIVWSARLAVHRSYRDEYSRDSMRAMGVDVSADDVHPDLAFGLCAPPDLAVRTGVVGIGVMDYRGRNGDRDCAEELHHRYREAVTALVLHVLDGGRRVRLFTGDRLDGPVAAALVAEVRSRRPGLPAGAVLAEPSGDLNELMRQMAGVDAVVATRYHNVLCALKTSRPTVCLGYAAKHDALMASMGLGDFCLPARDIATDRLIERFVTLEARAPELQATLRERNRVVRERLTDRLTGLSASLLPAAARSTGGPVAATTVGRGR